MDDTTSTPDGPDGTDEERDRPDDECPRCESSGMTAENPVLDDTYECSDCQIAFNAEGEVLE
jgi:hypothetical protein